ncbi:hypothetical protein DPMN_113935 [Dreissena polymorpha]|uniref:Uncharacterized protein n=1 Tax=Dreissena polymorpha TaxID=45954 RepID=A0A9D4KIZ3_DREPO|nr:hypothetical protein DPMN_113935 [Dreissena polymorpha]
MVKFQLPEIGQTCSSVLETRAARGSYRWNNQHIDRYTLLPVRDQIVCSCLQVQNPIFLVAEGCQLNGLRSISLHFKFTHKRFGDEQILCSFIEQYACVGVYLTTVDRTNCCLQKNAMFMSLC